MTTDNDGRTYDLEIDLFRQFAATGAVSTRLLMAFALGVYDRPILPWGRDGLAFSRLELKVFEQALAVKTQEFQGRVWFDAGLAEFIRAQESAKLSDHYRDWHGSLADPTYSGFEMDVRCLSTAARFVVTFQASDRISDDQPEPGTYVSFITEEDSPFHRMGWQGIGGRARDVLRLCDIATFGWGQGEMCRHLALEGKKPEWRLRPDPNVCLV
jgi:hypothetical protein